MLEVYQETSVAIQDMGNISEKDNKRYFGVGSSLNKRYGNPYYHLKDLRSAMYYKFGVKIPVQEIIIVYNEE